MSPRRVQLVSLSIGTIIWAMAIAVLRFTPIAPFDGPLPFRAAVYVLTAGACAAIVLILARRLLASPRVVSASLVLPGMVLDVAVIGLWPQVFPNHPGAAAQFGGLMLWSYAAAILAGALADRRLA